MVATPAATLPRIRVRAPPGDLAVAPLLRNLYNISIFVPGMHHMKAPWPYPGHAFFSVTGNSSSSIVCTEITITHIIILEQQKILPTKCNCIKLPLMLNLTLLCVIANYFYHIPVHQ